MENKQSNILMADNKTDIASLEDFSLIEMLHLHDCLRTSLQSLLEEVELFARRMESNTSTQSDLRILSRKMHGRFQIIWSVFQAHSSAEDEFLWPAVEAIGYSVETKRKNDDIYQLSQVTPDKNTRSDTSCKKEHAEEQEKFVQIDKIFFKLRRKIDESNISFPSIQQIVNNLESQTRSLLQHLGRHLDREEKFYVPIVKEKLSVSELNDLIGQIMGRRSATTMANILDLALENLHGHERLSVLQHIKDALSGTFFDKWLEMSGWAFETRMMETKIENDSSDCNLPSHKRKQIEPSNDHDFALSIEPKEDIEKTLKILRLELASKTNNGSRDQPQLSKMIIAILENSSLPSEQKVSIIRCLMDSVSRLTEPKAEFNTHRTTK